MGCTFWVEMRPTFQMTQEVKLAVIMNCVDLWFDRGPPQAQIVIYPRLFIALLS